MTITRSQLGNILLAMANAAKPTNFPRDSYEYAVGNVLTRALMAGAQECHDEASDRWNRDLHYAKYIKFDPGTWFEVRMKNGNTYFYPHEIVNFDSDDIEAYRVVSKDQIPSEHIVTVNNEPPAAAPKPGVWPWFEHDGSIAAPVDAKESVAAIMADDSITTARLAGTLNWPIGQRIQTRRRSDMDRMGRCGNAGRTDRRNR